MDYNYDEYKLMKHAWENTKHLTHRTLFTWKINALQYRLSPYLPGR